ncbi:proline rich transmembrane protein 1B-like [Dreissena polymorpha]|uniref:Uncharacterized protein n=1 Tax=Dreissena polymorpha TaxID=45954 RepID=A0A9D4ELN5_DREPO|nr:proline rich transmembrane protein 1B-like [Dreissena polymorpha]KAH3781573.1 hypothetical protein DPMN_159409 [Dreissena polymorpha]
MMEKAANENPPSDYPVSQPQFQTQQHQQQQPSAFTQQAVYHGQPDNKEHAGYIQPSYVGEPGQVVVLSQPQPAAVIVQVGTVPTDYMVSSILACLFCFWPTGLAAIYFSMETRKMIANGNMAQANSHSLNARNLVIVTTVIGLIWIIIVIVVRAVNG